MSKPRFLFIKAQNSGQIFNSPGFWAHFSSNLGLFGSRTWFRGLSFLLFPLGFANAWKIFARRIFACSLFQSLKLENKTV